MPHPAHALSIRRTLSLLAAILASSTLAACDSTPKSTTPEERIAATPAQHDKYIKFGYRVDWRGFPSLAPGASLKRIAVLGDVVAAQDSAADVTILEARSGERRWSDSVANPLTRFVGLNRDGKRFMVSSESQAYIYDVDTGTLLAKHNFADNVNTHPVQVGELIIFGCTNGRVLGHLLLNGFKQWGAFATGTIETDPVLVGDTGTIGVVSNGGDVLLLDGLTGSIRGTNHIYGGTDAQLGVAPDAIYVASRDHSLYAFSIDQARLLWRVRTEAPLHFTPVFHEGMVYCDMGPTGLTAYDAKTGKPAWENKAVHGSVIAVRAGRLIVWDNKTATLVDPARGGVLETSDLQNIDVIATDKFVDGNIYVGSAGGVITKLTPRK